MVREVYDSLFFPSYLSFPLEVAMSFIMPPSAVTSTSSIIIRITLVHPFATSWPSSPKGDARTLRDLLSVSYGMKTILLTGSLRSPPPIRLRRTSPCSGGRINRSMPSCRGMAPLLSTHSPTAPRGEGGGVSHQRGNASPTPAGRLYGFIQTGAFYKFRGALHNPQRHSRCQT